MPTDPLSVVLADCHHFFREGLRGMLDTAGMEIVGEAKSGTETATLVSEHKPDLVVIDPGMPDSAVVPALRQITTASPASRIVVLGASSEERDVLDALRSGACAYLLKSSPVDELVGGIRQAGLGQAVLSDDALRTLVSAAHAEHEARAIVGSADGVSLTARELDVLSLIVQGADNAAIGLELSISRHTVKQHVTNIFEKLSVRSRVEAAVYAVRTGLV